MNTGTKINSAARPSMTMPAASSNRATITSITVWLKLKFFIQSTIKGPKS